VLRANKRQAEIQFPLAECQHAWTVLTASERELNLALAYFEK